MMMLLLAGGSKNKPLEQPRDFQGNVRYQLVQCNMQFQEIRVLTLRMSQKSLKVNKNLSKTEETMQTKKN
jgi:hypothetical protein